MIIGRRLRQLREKKGLTQGLIEQRSGLLKCYVSRVENGHTVPSLGTLERFAAALEIPVHEIFYTSGTRAMPNLSQHSTIEEVASEDSSEDEFVQKLSGFINRISECDRSVLLVLARKMATR
jgi:transcriptional regulator with XRE-family HTH domain